MPTSTRPAAWHVIGPSSFSFPSHLLSFSVRLDESALSGPTTTQANIHPVPLLCEARG